MDFLFLPLNFFFLETILLYFYSVFSHYCERFKISMIQNTIFSDMMDPFFSFCRVRFHYGHPDVFDRIFHFTRGGFSKASCGINLSEDIFAGNIVDSSFLAVI